MLALADTALVDHICMKYFGTKPHQHKSQVYNIYPASGEAYIFSQVDSLNKVSGNAYTEQEAIYYTG